MVQHKFLSRLTAMFAAVATAVTMCATGVKASATTSYEAVNDDRDGILQIEVHYAPKGKEDTLVQTGTGFLINKTTILTCAHVVEIDAATQQAIEDIYSVTYNEDHEFDEEYVEIKIAILADNKEPATVQRASEDGDYAVLTIDTELQTKKALSLGDSDAVTQGQNVSALGFPSIVNVNQNNTSYTPYTASDVSVTAGTVSKTQYVWNDSSATAKYIQHSATLSDGSSGGPLVDNNGNVIGINAGSNSENTFFYSLEINQVKELLDLLGIEYTNGTGATVSDNSTTEESVADTSEAEITTTTTIQTTTTTATVAEPDDSEPDESDNITTYIIIGGVAVVVIVIIIIVIILLSGKKKQPANVTLNNNGDRFIPPTGATNYRPNPSPANPYASPQQTMPQVGAGETSILNAGAGETSVLGMGAGGSATLVREKNGQTIQITGHEFTIGKLQNSVTYCLNNNSVSRIHAKIVNNGGTYSLVDLGSKNGTFINGVRLNAQESRPLKSGDKIMLADEKFEFRG